MEVLFQPLQLECGEGDGLQGQDRSRNGEQIRRGWGRAVYVCMVVDLDGSGD